MPANTEPLHEANDAHSYVYRRRLSGGELVPAVIAGVCIGLAGFYLARLMIQRTRLVDNQPVGRPLRARPRLHGDRG